MLLWLAFMNSAANQLNYWGSENAESRTQLKHGPQRKIQPI